MQNVNIVSRLEFHAFSNGGLDLAASLILCTGKRITIQGNYARIQPGFSACNVHTTQTCWKAKCIIRNSIKIRSSNSGLETS